MNKKTIILIALTALVSGMLYALPTFASTPAQGSQPPAAQAPAGQPHRPDGKQGKGGAHFFRGQIAALGENNITLEARNGRQISLSVDENTVYTTPEHGITFGDLQTGDQIAFEARRNKDGTVNAHVVIQLPEGYDARALRRSTFQGEVWSLSSDSITLQTRQGEQVVLSVDANTEFLSPTGMVQTFDDLQIHMRVGLFATPQEDGSLHANVLIAARPRTSKHAGTIASVDGNSLTLHRRDGQTITFQVSESTRFKGQADSLEALQVDMPVIVAAYPDSNGVWQALFIASRRQP